MKPLKIAVGVGGRFHADRMLSAFLHLGLDAKLYTSYPRSRFPNLPRNLIHPTLYPECFFRVCRSLGKERSGSNFKMKYFGRALARELDKLNLDVFLGWSSFSLESFKKQVAPRQILMRDSCHIKFQMDLLQVEAQKMGASFSRDVVAEQREIEEYELADEIFVLSEFAKKSFVINGVSEEKIKILRLGVDTSLFYPSVPDKQSGPLKVVYFGALSVRKGIPYLFEAIKKLEHHSIEFHLIGNIEPELSTRIPKSEKIKAYPSMPQKQLAEFLRGMDVFVFPTLEDGFGQTLIQAMASGLVPVFTPNSGASELVSSEEGIKVPAQNSQALAEALDYLYVNPQKRIELQLKAAGKAKTIQWSDYERQLLGLLS